MRWRRNVWEEKKKKKNIKGKMGIKEEKEKKEKNTLIRQKEPFC